MNRYPVPDDGVHANAHIARNVTLNATAFNKDRFPDALDTTYAYPDGHCVPVTYFQLVTVSVIDKTQPVDVNTGMVHPNHRSYLKINNFEIFLEKEFDYVTSASNEGSETTCEGTALVLPGFKPTKGDLFYYLLNDGQWGIMAVRDVERLSISAGSYHRITFSLHDYLTPAFQKDLDTQVTNQAYYERVSFFTNKFTLLKHDSYILLQQLTQLRNEMCDWYLRKYWDQCMGSIIHPSGYYDPYLVTYLHHKISIRGGNRRPRQLYSRTYDFSASIWFPLVEGNRPRIDQCESKWRIRTFVPSFWAGDITSLADKFYVQLGEKSERDVDYVEFRLPADNPQETPYAGRSEAFYAADVTRMTPFEEVVYQAIIGNISSEAAYAMAKDYYEWDVKKAFYDIPFALFLIDTGLYSLGR